MPPIMIRHAKPTTPFPSGYGKTRITRITRITSVNSVCAADKAIGEMIIHDSARLHGRVDSDRPGEPEPVPPQLCGHGLRGWRPLRYVICGPGCLGRAVRVIPDGHRQA